MRTPERTGWNYLLQNNFICNVSMVPSKILLYVHKRVISNAFLILISPLVTVTYAIDKSNDCKAQAFNSWFEEMITNVFIQPMHLLLFLVLLYSAGEIAQLYPIVAILFLFGIGKAEKKSLEVYSKLRGASIENVEDGTSFYRFNSKNLKKNYNILMPSYIIYPRVIHFLKWG